MVLVLLQLLLVEDVGARRLQVQVIQSEIDITLLIVIGWSPLLRCCRIVRHLINRGIRLSVVVFASSHLANDFFISLVQRVTIVRYLLDGREIVHVHT